MTQAHAERPSSADRYRPTIRRCIDAWFESHVGTVPAYADDTSLLTRGLDSLAAATLAMDLSDALGIAVPDDAVFDHPSVAALAGWIARQAGVAEPQP